MQNSHQRLTKRILLDAKQDELKTIINKLISITNDVTWNNYNEKNNIDKMESNILELQNRLEQFEILHDDDFWTECKTIYNTIQLHIQKFNKNYIFTNLKIKNKKESLEAIFALILYLFTVTELDYATCDAKICSFCEWLIDKDPTYIEKLHIFSIDNKSFLPNDLFEKSTLQIFKEFDEYETAEEFDAPEKDDGTDIEVIDSEDDVEVINSRDDETKDDDNCMTISSIINSGITQIKNAFFQSGRAITTDDNTMPPNNNLMTAKVTDDDVNLPIQILEIGGSDHIEQLTQYKIPFNHVCDYIVIYGGMTNFELVKYINNAIECNCRLNDPLYVYIRLHGNSTNYLVKDKKGLALSYHKLHFTQCVIFALVKFGFTNIHILDNSCGTDILRTDSVVNSCQWINAMKSELTKSSIIKNTCSCAPGVYRYTFSDIYSNAWEEGNLVVRDSVPIALLGLLNKCTNPSICYRCLIECMGEDLMKNSNIDVYNTLSFQCVDAVICSHEYISTTFYVDFDDARLKLYTCEPLFKNESFDDYATKLGLVKKKCCTEVHNIRTRAV